MLTRNNRKRTAVLAMLLAIAMAPMFAVSTAKAGGETLNLSFIKNAVNLVVGVFAGGYVLLKAALDIFHAVRNSSEDQNALKKAIGSLVLNVAILGGFMFTINYILAGMGGTDGSGAIDDSTSAQNAFFGALSGALAQVL